MKSELTEGDSLEVSDDTPIYNPHTLPLTFKLFSDFSYEGIELVDSKKNKYLSA